MSLFTILVLIALFLSVGSSTNKIPLWPAVFVLCVALLIEAFK